MSSRHSCVTLATGTAELEAAEAMIGDLPAGERITLGVVPRAAFVACAMK